jgi:hypothetical protein
MAGAEFLETFRARLLAAMKMAASDVENAWVRPLVAPR